MERDAILDQLRDLLESEFDIDREDVTSDALLYDDLDFDSIDAVDMMAWMVKLTGKRMDPEDFRNVRTVGDVVDEISRQLS